MRFDPPQEEWPSSSLCACRLWCPHIGLPKYLSLSGFEVRHVSRSSAILAHLVAEVMMPIHPEKGARAWPKLLQFSGMWRRVVWRNGFQYFGGTCPEDVLSPSLYHHLDDHNAMTSYLTELKFIHSLVSSLRGRAGRNQSPVMWPVWLWHTAYWASSWR